MIFFANDSFLFSHEKVHQPAQGTKRKTSR